jgi:hypothetical protein
MNDFQDTEFRELRAHWKPPSAPDSLDRAVLGAYRSRFVRRRKIVRFWIPVAAAIFVALVGGVLGGAFIERTPTTVQPARQNWVQTGYVPVRQPKITVISQGEQP